jgi:phosphotransacetylase
VSRGPTSVEVTAITRNRAEAASAAGSVTTRTAVGTSTSGSRGHRRVDAIAAATAAVRV